MQDSSELKSRSPSIGRVTTALAATFLVAAGTLVATGALLLIAAVIPLGINAAQSIDIRLIVKQLTWGDGKAIAAITIFAGTYLVIAIGKLPGYRPVSLRPLPTIEGINAMPWRAPLAGLTGAVAVFAGLALIDKLGAGPVNGLIITANLLASLAIDQFGLMNMPLRALNVWRIIGGVLMAVGIILVFRF
jgi:uncharacterized membrane protein YdcZ (DUF606 family)